MRTLGSVALLALALSALLVASCAGGNPTQPPVDFDREIACNGGGGGDGGNRPPRPPFEWDCQRFFDVDYACTRPDGEENLFEGMIRIDDADCSALESDVRVMFFFDLEGRRHRIRILPGTKVEADTGTVYSGERSWERTFRRGRIEHSFEVLNEYELTVTPDPDQEGGYVLDGWFYHYRYDLWTFPNGEERERERERHITISGVEIENPRD